MTYLLRTLLLSVMLSAAFGSPSALGEIIYVDVDAPPGGDGTSWGSAYVHPQLALDHAVAGDEIWVAEGTYEPLVTDDCAPRSATISLKGGVAMYGGFAGTERNLGERNWIAHETRLSGSLSSVAPSPCCTQGSDLSCVCETCLDTVCAFAPECCTDGWSYACALIAQDYCQELACYEPRARHVAVAVGLKTTAIIDGFVLTDAWSELPEGGSGLLLEQSIAMIANCRFVALEAINGGAIAVLDSTVTMIGCSFAQCAAAGIGTNRGGAINVVGSVLSIADCNFQQNHADTGGAIHVEASIVDVLDSSFAVNRALAPQAQGGGGAIRVFDGTIELTGCTFSTSAEAQPVFEAHHGGAIHVEEGTIVARQCVFLGLDAAERGGGIDMEYSEGSFEGCLFLFNTAGERGAALAARVSVIDLVDTQFVGQQSGAVFARGDGPEHSILSFDGCLFSGNTTAGDGAALHKIHAVEATFTECTFEGNIAAGIGGAIASEGSLSTVLTNCLLEGNEAFRGGAVAGGGQFLQCVLRNNTALEYGGASYTTKQSYFESSLIDGNTAPIGGGGLAVALESSVDLVNCTLVNNATMGDGGALLLGAPLDDFSSAHGDVINTIFWDNVSDDGRQIVTWGFESYVYPKYSIIQGGTEYSAPIFWIDADPMFVDAATGDYRVLAGSPAIDAGGTDAGGDQAPLTSIDLLGADRFVDDPDTPNAEPDSVVDVGAYEFQADACAGDCNGDGIVNAADMLALLAAWGTAGPCDIDGSGLVDAGDFAAVLAGWGQCP